MVVLANSKTYGTGAVINPIGKLNDGKFELVIVRRLALLELLKMIFKRGIYNPAKVEILRTTSVTLRAHKPIYFQADGEYLGRQQEVRAEIVPACLNVLVGSQETAAA